MSGLSNIEPNDRVLLITGYFDFEIVSVVRTTKSQIVLKDNRHVYSKKKERKFYRSNGLEVGTSYDYHGTFTPTIIDYSQGHDSFIQASKEFKLKKLITNE